MMHMYTSLLLMQPRNDQMLSSSVRFVKSNQANGLSNGFLKSMKHRITYSGLPLFYFHHYVPYGFHYCSLTSSSHELIGQNRLQLIHGWSHINHGMHSEIQNLISFLNYSYISCFIYLKYIQIPGNLCQIKKGSLWIGFFHRSRPREISGNWPNF